MSEHQEPYITATPTLITDADVMMLSKRERDFIEVWRANPKAAAIAVDPSMKRLWAALCNISAGVRRREVEPIVVVDLIRHEAYTLHDVSS